MEVPNVKHGTCLFCDHNFQAKSKARKFCHECLPEHADNQREYKRRYMILRDACWGDGMQAKCSIAHLHPKEPSRRDSGQWHGPPAPKACAQCGEPHWRGRKFCSKICSRRSYESTLGADAKAAKKQRSLHWRSRTSEYQRQRLIDNPHLRILQREKSRQYKSKHRGYSTMEPACVDCGCPIPTGWKRCAPHRDEFKSTWLAEYRRTKPNVRAANQRYRARKRTATVERFGDTEIFERDGWLCQLCGTPINKDVRKPHPDSVSLDHIVPLSLGGAHSRANTQCAHLGCNSRKNARYDGYQQMALEVA